MTQEIITLQTHGQGLYEFTDRIEGFVIEQSILLGMLVIFIRHTSCSLIIQENADPSVQIDLKNYFARLVPPSTDPTMEYLTHTYEGPDDMPAHIKAALTQSSIIIPIRNGKLLLGRWQGVYLFEHRDRSHSREVVLHISN